MGQGAAPEGRKARAENHARIEQVGVLHRGLAQHGDALVHEREHEAVREIRRCLHRAGVGLHGLALPPLVEAPAALAAELLRGEMPREARQGGRRAPEFPRDNCTHMLADVAADDVGELDRPHRHAEVHGDPIDERAGNAFLEREHGLLQVGRENAIDDDARRTAAGERQLVDPARKTERGRDDVGAGLRAAHDLDQRHLRHGVEEMQADEPCRIGEPLSQQLELDARGVRREQRADLHGGFELRIELALGVDILVDGLDDHVGPCNALASHVGPEAGQRGGNLGIVPQPLREILARARQRRLDVFPAGRTPARGCARFRSG